MLNKGEKVMAPVLMKGDTIRWMPGEVEKIIGRCVHVKYQCGETVLRGCWFPEDLRRRDV